FCINARDGKTLWTQKMGRNNFGSMLDAGSELLLLVPDGTLTVFKPSGKGFEQIAQIKLQGSDFYAHPVVSGSRIYAKDKDAVTMYTTGE
ncbi:MAG TPA: hypothetical protein VN541_01430, partial [Tepidisphaeraceae bacterium]|nr:hypothetical protein [Tepidisphaeraceae bacterium]